MSLGRRDGIVARRGRSVIQPEGVSLDGNELGRREPVEVRGCSIACLKGGAGETVLYLHGADGAGHVLPFMSALAEHHALWVPEHPGFGQSDEPDWLDNIHDLAYFYLDFLAHLDLRDVHLVGMSLGGWIALEIAIRSTARIKSLTVAGAAGIHVPGLATGDVFTWSPEETLRQAFHDPALAERAIAALPPDVEGDDTYLKNRAAFTRLAWEPRLHDPHLAKWLHRIDVPTAILWAEQDRILEVGHARALADLIPGARVTVLPRCGHLMHLEQPDAFVQAIADHIRGASS